MALQTANSIKAVYDRKARLASGPKRFWEPQHVSIAAAKHGAGESESPVETAPTRNKGKVRSKLPNAAESQALLELHKVSKLQAKKDLFTDDAWEGMQRIAEYSNYVESVCTAEEAPGCEQCTDHRLLLEQAWQVVANEFYDPLGHFSQAKWADQLLTALKAAGGMLRTQKETYAAAQRMVASLGDQYSEFLGPSQFRQALRRPRPAEREYLAAQFNGVGLQIASRSRMGGWLVAAALAESPAEQAGIQRGERIMEIDGYPADDLTAAEVNSFMRGTAGSSVILTIGAREPNTDMRTLYLERRALPQPPLKRGSLTTASGQPVSYLRMHYFSSETSKMLQRALREGEADGVAGYVIDLRNNPGGVFEEAIGMASFFLEPGSMIAETVRNDEVIDNHWQAGSLSREIFPSLPGVLTRKPVVLVTNSSTASASEVLTGALRDNHRAVVVGDQTFGKGVVQYYFPMADGSGLRLTVAKYLTPRRDLSREGGIRPDVKCDDYPRATVTDRDDRCLVASLTVLDHLIDVAASSSQGR
ncbi:hypothetical protein WJX72_003921 [[Myrmecia] bisecta]|uniref:PDZ domain-containing protein n=1 Tax=[Myrmecia] bisecta TaxID=41462 RepID=A0AAW1PA98_9CHLO